MHLREIYSGKIVQTLMSTTSKWGLSREAWAALLRIRMGLECREVI